MHLSMLTLKFRGDNQSKRNVPIAFIIREFGDEKELIKVSKARNKNMVCIIRHLNLARYVLNHTICRYCTWDDEIAVLYCWKKSCAFLCTQVQAVKSFNFKSIIFSHESLEDLKFFNL